MPTLTELAELYGVDKLYAHSYVPKYERLFEGRTIRRVLDLGIGYESLMAPFVPKYVHGASLKLWRDYFPGAHIYGADIRDDTLFEDERITTIQCDQSRYRDLDGLIAWSGGWFDFVCDDGSHQFLHQLFTAAVLLPHLNPGGVYVIEDCYPNTGEDLVRYLGGELIVGNKRPDDCLVVIRK